MRNYVIALATAAIVSLWICRPGPAFADDASPAKYADTPAIKTAGFAILASTDSGGHTIYMVVGKASSANDVIAALADPLGKIFDAKPAFAGGFADAKTKKTGGCTFTAVLHGKPVKGCVFAGVNDAGVGSASIIFGPADISKDEMTQLAAAIPAKPKMTRHNFPDNSGSVDLPDGWTTKTQSLADFPLIITGPSGQTVVEGGFFAVSLPNGMRAKVAMGNYQTRLQRFHTMQRIAPGNPQTAKMDPGPPPDLNKDLPNIFCDYCKTPQDVYANLYPILKQKAQKKNQPWFEVNKIFALDPVAAPGGGSAFTLYTAGTRHDGDKTSATRAMQRMEITLPDALGDWGVWVNSMGGPDATFNQDVLVMMDIVNSIQINGPVVSQKIADRGAAAMKMIQQVGDSDRKMMETNHKAYMAESQDEFDRNQSAIATQEKAVHDSSSDMIEYSLGVRDVYDSATGKMGQVDLFNSHAITQGLNDLANDPTRFVEIPLRDER